MRAVIRQELARKGALTTTNAYAEASVTEAFNRKTYTVSEVAQILRKSRKFVHRKYCHDARVFGIRGTGSRVSLLIPHHVIEADLRAMLSAE
jgi:hypothetical protein